MKINTIQELINKFKKEKISTALKKGNFIGFYNFLKEADSFMKKNPINVKNYTCGNQKINEDIFHSVWKIYEKLGKGVNNVYFLVDLYGSTVKYKSSEDYEYVLKIIEDFKEYHYYQFKPETKQGWFIKY